MKLVLCRATILMNYKFIKWIFNEFYIIDLQLVFTVCDYFWIHYVILKLLNYIDVCRKANDINSQIVSYFVERAVILFCVSSLK